ncbi:MAG: C25 family cysteine peptidase, partial [Bacteroidia bacterium]|nr:C25 family cysteine peptidase [Bacteroidia bacterium]
MKRFFLILCFSVLVTPWLSAQSFDYGNAWYKTQANQPWVKIIVDQDGIYRVTKADLLLSGYDLSSVQGNRLHLYYRGKEVPLFVGSTAGTWQYFDFYGQRNDGRIDSIMYRNPVDARHRHSPDEQPNKALSIFTDESAYFLTWNNSPSGFRFFNEYDPTYNLYTPQASFRFRSYREYPVGDPSTRYVQGGSDATSSFYTLNSDYVTGEGYQGPGFGVGSPTTVAMATPYVFNDGLPLEVEMRVFGRSLTEHILRVDLNGNSSNPVLDTSITNATVYQKTYTREFYPSSALTDETDLTFHALKQLTDNNHVSYAAITYSRQPKVDGDSLIWVSNWDKASKSYLRIDGMGGTDSVYVYDLKNRFRSTGVMFNGTQGRVIIQGFPNTRDLLVVTEKAIQTPRIESPALNKLFDPTQGATYVIITDRKLSASAQAYAQYRDTATTTPINSVKIVYTDEIYDEFGYGSITPWAIKRFCKYALDSWNVKPEYFLMWGKGRYRTREANPQYPLVPTFGYPSTDYEFVCNWRQDTIDINPEAAIGRLNIYSDAEGLDYLQKVNEYEHTTWSPWMKKGVFLGGGGNEAEQSDIGGAFQYMTTRFKGIPFGGEVIYYQKTNSSIVIDPNEATYHDEISDGSEIIHFFGHSTSNIQDVSIREPFEYNNFGKYPLMIAMGCYGGDFTVGSEPAGASFGERWVREKGRGSIGYIGNSSAGYLDPLRKYGRIFYDYAYGSMSGEPIGNIMKEVLTIYTDSLRGIFFTNHGRQLNLQGDPAVKLYVSPAPDLQVTNSSVFFTPDNFSAQDDSFRISIIVENLGRVSADSFSTTIRHRLPDGSIFEHPTIRRPMVPYRDTLSISLINPVGDALTGQNFFEIFVDAEEEIAEYNELNNFISIGKIVPGNIPAILSPREYAIVPDNKVVLQASTVFMTTDPEIGYVFEIDTVETFDSPAKVNSGTVIGNSYFSAWEVPFALADSGVYYWRVRLADITPRVWSSASFKYIPTRTGWAQSQLPQFQKNTYNNMNLNTLGQRWEFAKFASEYEFTTREGSNTSFNFSINGGLIADLSLSGVYSDQVAYVILDQYTLKPKLSAPISGVIGAGAVPGQLYKVRDAILAADNGDYVIVGSQGNPKVPLWPEDLFAAMKLIGVSDNIRQVKDGKAFIVMGRKGYTSGATEVYTPTAESKYSLSTVLFA